MNGPEWTNGSGLRIARIAHRIGAARQRQFTVEVQAPGLVGGRYRISIEPGGIGRWVSYVGNWDRGCELGWKGLQILIGSLEAAIPYVVGS